MCKKIKSLSHFYKCSLTQIKQGKATKDGYRNYCKVCDKIRLYKYRRGKGREIVAGHKRKYYLKNRDRILSEMRTSLKRKFYDYKHNAIVDKRFFNLTYEYFLEFIKNPCFYCGAVEKIGIDRKDSKRGYEQNNIVPCCSRCNQIKMDMTFNEFINQIKLIYNHIIMI